MYSFVAVLSQVCCIHNTKHTHSHMATEVMSYYDMFSMQDKSFGFISSLAACMYAMCKFLHLMSQEH